MRNSAQHEILNAHRYNKYPLFQVKNAIILLIDVKMPINVGILTFMTRKKFHAQLTSMNVVKTSNFDRLFNDDRCFL